MNSFSFLTNIISIFSEVFIIRDIVSSVTCEPISVMYQDAVRWGLDHEPYEHIDKNMKLIGFSEAAYLNGS